MADDKRELFENKQHTDFSLQNKVIILPVETQKETQTNKSNQTPPDIKSEKEKGS